MDFPPLGIHFSPKALTRSVQSIITPLSSTIDSTNGPTGSAVPHWLPWRSITVKAEDTVKIEEQECITTIIKHDEDETAPIVQDAFRFPFRNPFPATFNSYSDIVNEVARNYKIQEKSRVKRPKKRVPKPTNISKKKEKVKPKVRKRRLCADLTLLEAPLRVKQDLSTFQSNGRDQMWWFVLKVLMDPSNRHIIAWTGQYYSFRVIDKGLFTQMWCNYNYRSRIIAWSSVCRAMRLCYGDKGILTPVSQRDRIWAFVVDISIPLMISREAIQEFIHTHKELPLNPIFVDGKRSIQAKKIDMDESANDMKMDVHSSYIPNLDSHLHELDSVTTLLPPPPSPHPFSPIKHEFSNRPPLTSPLFWTDSTTANNSLLSPLPSPVWLPPLTPMFSPRFHF